ncbi:MAG: hypothetical protein PHG91_08755 [Syntrophales bacterium]|nr:hypothetical protein [Syntrophales bacterium]MDD5233472.1 hypothetical protein [Syntrophales bacterium]MDD5533024.1 hypothetical protein [Syntrophales bacterium]HPL64007.1 hypothetical protein [Syntrophales bacterium]
MVLTPAEAIEKICPLTRGGAGALCIGDKCMGWRWAEPMPGQLRIEHRSDCNRQQVSILGATDECPFCGAKPFRIELAEIRRGYCGLAGIPEF